MDRTIDNQKTFDDDDFSPITPVNLKPGMFLGKDQNYRLEKLLGAGTYGQAWLAAEIEDEKELRKVVCKVLPALIQKQKDEMEKVIKTFQLVQPLIHQYICPIYALKSDPNCGCFFVLAYADGGTLWDWFISQPDHASGLPVSRVVEVLLPVAMALDHAHAMGVVHRDVKPENILLALRGGRKIPWLSDFGISAQIHRTVTQTVGARGRTGTPAYMAPEQCQNQTQDGRTDQYALGVLAYLFLSGHLPFDADDPVAIWGQVVYSPVPPLENVPKSVNAAVLRALAKKREDRFNSCVEFINALKNQEEIQKELHQMQAKLLEKERQERLQFDKMEQERLNQENIQRQKKLKITVPTDCSLEQACEQALDGAVITVKPGKYTLEKTIRISRKITLRGETGHPEDVVIDCPVFDTFEITGGSPSFQNLTVSCSREAKDDQACCGFYISGGTPQIFRCIIISRLGSGILIEGKGANPSVEKCIAKDCGTSGVMVWKEGRGEFSECEIYGNTKVGIYVQEEGNPAFTRCKIHDGKDCGVFVLRNGLGKFSDCEIYGNAKAGIYVQEEGNPTFIGCKIRDGKANGVIVAERGLGKFNNCEIYGNVNPGIYVEESGNPAVTECKIHDGKSNGVTIAKEGLGKFQACEIYGNEHSGIEVSESGNPTVTGCKIHNGKDCGVFVLQEGLGEFQDCDIYGNVLPGIEVLESGHPAFTRCNIHDGKNGGVYVSNGGVGSFLNCEIYQNANIEIVIDESGDPVLTGCKIHDGKSAGVLIEKKGRGHFLECEIYRNADVGIIVRESGCPTVTRCKIYDGNSAGMSIFDKGRGMFSECEIFRNAGAGIVVSQAGNPTIARCKIQDGKGGGVTVADKGMGTFNNNILHDNKPTDWDIDPFGGCKVQGGGNTPELPKTFFRKFFST